MNKMLILHAGIMCLGVFVSSVSQIFLKKAAIRKYDSLIKEYLNFKVIFAYFLFVIATFMSIYAYRVVPLSMGPILEASGYIYVTAFGAILFKEKISLPKLIALGCIVLGIIVYSV